MGTFTYSGKKLRLMDYLTGFHLKATLTEGSYNTQLMLWYVVNSPVQP